jgi:hypothetical protein
VLVLAGAVAGALGGLGVGAGVAVAESSSRLRNGAGLMFGGAAGGTAVGITFQWLMRWTLAAVVGLNLPIAGGVEGLVIGAAAGAGYAIARRLRPARSPLYGTAVVAALCAAGALALTWAGRPLVGGTLHLIAREARGAQISLEPLGWFVGEPGFGPLSQAVIGACEGGIFGLGVGMALLGRRSHADLTRPSSPAQDSAGS